MVNITHDIQNLLGWFRTCKEGLECLKANTVDGKKGVQCIFTHKPLTYLDQDEVMGKLRQKLQENSEFWDLEWQQSKKCYNFNAYVNCIYCNDWFGLHYCSIEDSDFMSVFLVKGKEDMVYMETVCLIVCNHHQQSFTYIIMMIIMIIVMMMMMMIIMYCT